MPTFDHHDRRRLTGKRYQLDADAHADYQLFVEDVRHPIMSRLMLFDEEIVLETIEPLCLVMVYNGHEYHQRGAYTHRTLLPQ